MDEIGDLLHIFGEERYMLAFTDGRTGADGGGIGGGVISRGINKTKQLRPGMAKGTASIILHRDATGADTVKSILALEYFHDELSKAGIAVVGARTRPEQKNINNNNKQQQQKPQQQGMPSVNVAVNGEPTTAMGVAQNVAASERGGKRRTTSLLNAQVFRCLQAAQRRADEGAPGFFAALSSLGWNTDKFMFGNIKSKVEWRV